MADYFNVSNMQDNFGSDNTVTQKFCTMSYKELM